MEKTLKILNETGLHARPAGIFVKTATQFKSDINIIFNESSFNAKSIMNILSLGLTKDAEITISASGPDEEEAIAALVSLIESKFGEE
ncbi:MAG: HPr family phosphocarrier protein [Marinisporobacter sp.]|jgi:phosphocarrier protein|nr:HPr family phosphocarrier protein [Marinisporobacter sp.]